MISIKDVRFFKVAAAMAETSVHPHFKIGAAIVIKKTVIALGANDLRSHPLQKQYNQYRFDDDKCKHTTHAEMNALLRAKRVAIDLSDAKLFVYRKTKKGTLGNSRPCVACMNAIKDFGIKDVYYTTNFGYSNEMITSVA